MGQPNDDRADRSPQQSAHPARRRRQLAVGPGEIVGSLTLAPGGPPPNEDDGIAESRGPLLVQLDFTDAAGVPRRFSRLLPAEALLPLASQPVRCVDDRQAKPPLVTALLDDRADMSLRLDDGSSVVIRCKYTDARFTVEAHAGHAAVTAVIQPVLDPHARDRVLAVEYEVPWERLLWEVPPRLVAGVVGIGPEVVDRAGAAPQARSAAAVEAAAAPAKAPASSTRPARGPRKRWPVAVRVEQLERQAVECPGGRRLVIEPGPIAGLLSMDQSADATGGMMPYIDVRFDFRAASGAALRYRATLDAAALLPTLDTNVSAAEPPMQWDLGVMANVRRDVPFAFTLGNGGVVSGSMQGRRLELRVDVHDHEVTVHASISSDHAVATRGMLRVGYSLPIGRVLWRRAATGSYPDLAPESAPYCQIDELRSGDAAAPPSPNVRFE